MAEITMTLQEFTTQQQALHKAENEAADLRKQLALAQVADPSGVVPDLIRAIRAARNIMPFSLMFIPHDKFPIGDLLTFANVFENLPGGDIDDQTLAIDWRSYVKEVLDEREQIERAGARARNAGVPL